MSVKKSWVFQVLPNSIPPIPSPGFLHYFSYQGNSSIYSIDNNGNILPLVSDLKNYNNILFVSSNTNTNYTPIKGSIDRPFRSIQDARNNATDGDKIIILGGAYDVKGENLYKVGVSYVCIGNPIITDATFYSEDDIPLFTLIGDGTFIQKNNKLFNFNNKTVINFEAHTLKLLTPIYLSGEINFRLNKIICNSEYNFILENFKNGTITSNVIETIETSTGKIPKIFYINKGSGGKNNILTVNSSIIKPYENYETNEVHPLTLISDALDVDRGNVPKIIINSDIIGGFDSSIISTNKAIDLTINGNIIFKRKTQQINLTSGIGEGEFKINGDIVLPENEVEGSLQMIYINDFKSVTINGNITSHLAEALIKTESTNNNYTTTLTINGILKNNKISGSPKGIIINDTYDNIDLIILNTTITSASRNGIAIDGAKKMQVHGTLSTNVQLNNTTNILDPTNATNKILINEKLKA